MKGEIFEIIILQLDYHLIEKVRELRVRHSPYISMLRLSQELELGDSYISSVENPKLRVRYNLRALHKIATFFRLKSYTELFPKRVLPHEMVRIRLCKIPVKKGKAIPEEKPYQIISITPLTEEELKLWQANKLPYLTYIDQ
ncbi:hypothetical protein GR160_07795 [Flavobacterium sp. Sd200]|uniref:hypothetical protein n=1 Tax=Flavobacterium sp. Sd200 TaxID=2692211 RepID=UPI00136A0EDA|nr:hypothetical protein [Flavobacterium sp. Sd200]MXN91131.1 hypothetical protein [Flavobacterium sp. Sd200]